jgi:hypothetical protein
MFVLESRSLLVVFVFFGGGGVMDMDICAFMQVFWNHACNIFREFLYLTG